MRTRIRSLLAAGLIYCNVALLGNEVCAAGAFPCRLPLGSLLGDLFDVFPVFTHYETANTEIILLGLPQDAGDPSQDSNWLRLTLDEYFPYRQGEQHTRVLTATRSRPVDPRRQREAWAFLTRKILDRYNRQHPDHTIRQVRIRARTWPPSPNGYWAHAEAEPAAIRDLFTGP